ncbi:MAG: hypothetical protein ACTSUE_07230 [Promethearchaeota archaeon]
MTPCSSASWSFGLVWNLTVARSHHFVVYLNGGLKTAPLKWKSQLLPLTGNQ